MIGRLGSRDSDYILPFQKSVACENEKKEERVELGGTDL